MNKKRRRREREREKKKENSNEEEMKSKIERWKKTVSCIIRGKVGMGLYITLCQRCVLPSAHFCIIPPGNGVNRPQPGGQQLQQLQGAHQRRPGIVSAL